MQTGLRSSLLKLAVTAASVLPAAVVLAVPANADPVIYSPSYGSNGVFGVGAANMDEWVTAHIPPGRYRVEQAPSMPPYQSEPGYWQRCSAFPCAGNYPDHIIATGFPPPRGDEFMEVLPSDTAVRLANVTLTFAG